MKKSPYGDYCGLRLESRIEWRKALETLKGERHADFIAMNTRASMSRAEKPKPVHTPKKGVSTLRYR